MGPLLMRGLARQLRRVGPPQVLLWVPLLAALVVFTILAVIGLATPIYSALLGLIMAFDLLALLGPARLRPALLRAAPTTYALLLTSWGVALYVLPEHPATPMVRLSILLYVTAVYVFVLCAFSLCSTLPAPPACGPA